MPIPKKNQTRVSLHLLLDVVYNVSKSGFPSLFLLLLKHSYYCLSVETTMSWLWLAHGVCHLDAAVCNLPAIFIILLVTARFKRWATTATRFRHNGCCIFVISKHQHGNISNSLNHCYIIDLLAHTCDKQNLNCALSYAKNIVKNTDTARRHVMQITRNRRKCLLRYILFIQYQGYVMNINRGKAFMVCGMGGCSIALVFFACISSIIAAYRFSVSWILRFIVSAFLLQLAVTVLYILASSVKTETSLSTYFSSS